MLSRAVLPLTRPHVLASASSVRVSALAAQRPRWYAKPRNKYEVKPGATIKKPTPTPPSQKSQQSQESEPPKEQPEFETAAQPEAGSSSVRPYNPRHQNQLQ